LNVFGDGGMIATSNEDLYEKIIKLRNHGLKNRNECVCWGYNSRLDAIHAAIALVKLKYLDQWNNKHREIASFYRESLRDIVYVPEERNDEHAVYHLFMIRSEKRDELQKHLENKGIETKIHYPIPIHLQPAAKYLGYKQGDFPITEKIAKTMLSLPIHTEITRNQCKIVVTEIHNFFKGW